MKNKKLMWVLGIAGAVVIVLLIALYVACFKGNTAFSEKSKVLVIKSGSDVESLAEQLFTQGIIQNRGTFLWCAQLKRFSNVKPGRYKITSGMSNGTMVNLLRSGAQETILIRLDGLRDLQDLAGVLGKELEHDSTYFANYLLHPDTSAKYGFTPATFACLFIADTYDFYWSSSGNDLLKRMNEIYEKFWTAERRAKADSLNLTLVEVATLASIVKGETARKDEAPKIAGLYYNRIKMGMPLQADPTVLFGLNDRTRKRLLFSDLSIDHPYNTYRIAGLPPGPISLPEKLYLDAVLNLTSHNYIYMCAQPEGTGYHNFTDSYSEHQKNSALYQAWANKNNIYR
jgi:UPF0755 protein